MTGVSLLETKLEGAQSPQERARALNALAEAIIDTDPQRALRLSKKALDSCELTDSVALHCDSLYSLANAQWQVGRSSEALANLQKCIAVAEEEPLRGAGRAHNLLGVIHDTLGNYQDALLQLRLALEIFEGLKDPFGQAEALNSIGVNFARVGDHAQSLRFYQRSLELRRESKDATGEALALNNLGLAKKNLELYDEAWQAFRTSAETFGELGNERGEGVALGNLGTLYTQLDMFDEAHQAFELSAQRLKGTDNGIYRIEISRDWGELFLKQGSLEKGCARIRESLEEAQKIGARAPLYRAHAALAGALAQQRHYERAYQHLSKARKIEAEVRDEEAGKRHEQLQALLRVEQAEKERALLEEKNHELASAHEELKRLHLVLEEQADDLRRQARHDSLTGLRNRRYLDQCLEKEYARALRYKMPLSVAICDIDDFKRVNDHYSHAAGDVTIRTVADILSECTRDSDVVARYGGEEFVIVFPQTSLLEAAKACDKVRGMVAGHDWHGVGLNEQVTISIGISADLSVNGHEKLLGKADIKLLEAKRGGKNRVLY